MLNPEQGNLQIREEDGDIFVENLTEVPIESVS